MNEPEIVKCGKCGNTAFSQIISFVKISTIASKTGKAGIAPAAETFICTNCGTDISESDAIKDLQEKDKSGLVL